MTILRRVIHGAEAGVLAGAGIAGLFLILDVAQLAPLSTPVTLASSLWGPVALDPGSDTLARSLALGLGGARLVAYSLLHLLAFTAIGVVGAFLINTASFWTSLLGGVVYGTVACSALFYAGNWMTEAPMVLDAIGPTSIVLVNAMAGAIMGLGLHIGALDPGDSEAG